MIDARTHATDDRTITLVLTPTFTTAPCLMFVGSRAEVAEACAQAAQGVPFLRVASAAAAVQRMLVTRPLVIVVDDTIRGREVERINDCASGVGSELVQASATGMAGLEAAVQSALVAAQNKRGTEETPAVEAQGGAKTVFTLPDGPHPFSAESIAERVEPQRIGAYVLFGAVGENQEVLAVLYVGRSDTDLRERLQAVLSDPELVAGGAFASVTHFSFGYLESVASAFETECVLYHDWGPIMNEAHPRRPRGSACYCPVCEEDVSPP